MLDLRNPAVVREFQARIRALVALGIDGVKADRGDEVDLSGVAPALTNAYPLLFARAVMGALPPGAAAIFRAATVGSQAVVPGPLGGRPARGVRRPAARRSSPAQTAAMSGFPTWGSDIGGYDGPPYVDRRAVRPLGAARRGLAGDRGRRPGRRTRRPGSSAPPR